MASDRQRQRRRREARGSGSRSARSRELGLDDAAVGDAGLGEISEPPDPLDQAMPNVTEAELAEAGAAPPDVGGRRRVADEGPGEAERRAPRRGLFGRALDFLQASYNELRRVQWPDRKQVGQGTAVVLGFVVLAGAYLGLLDAIWSPVIKAIL